MILHKLNEVKTIWKKTESQQWKLLKNGKLWCPASKMQSKLLFHDYLAQYVEQYAIIIQNDSFKIKQDKRCGHFSLYLNHSNYPWKYFQLHVFILNINVNYEK